MKGLPNKSHIKEIPGEILIFFYSPSAWEEDLAEISISVAQPSDYQCESEEFQNGNEGLLQ